MTANLALRMTTTGDKRKSESGCFNFLFYVGIKVLILPTVRL